MHWLLLLVSVKAFVLDIGVRAETQANTEVAPQPTTRAQTMSDVAQNAAGTGGSTDGAGTSVQRGETGEEIHASTSGTDAAGPSWVPRDPIHYLPLHRAVSQGDWEGTKRIFDHDPSALTDCIPILQQTPLHIAIAYGCSKEFVMKLVHFIAEMGQYHALGIGDDNGNTPLHIAAAAGNTEAARILVSKDRSLPQMRNKDGETPLKVAARHGHKETILYLLEETHDVDPSPFAEKHGLELLNLLITADFYGIALTVLHRYPQLGREDHTHVRRVPLDILATKPQAFPSGSQQRRWQIKCANVLQKISLCLKGGFENRAERGAGDEEDPIEQTARVSRHLGVDTSFTEQNEALRLVKALITEAARMSVEKANEVLGHAVRAAARHGIHEFVSETIEAYPISLWLRDKEGRNIFELAVLHRQEKVFNLIYQIGSQKHFHLTSIDRDGNNILHLAAKLPKSTEQHDISYSNVRSTSGEEVELPSSIKMISGAALQMQRELQWFQEVKKHVPPQPEEMRNNYYKTPQEVFTESHKNLVKDGEKWMKSTAASANIVAALIITAMLGASFTTPGGRDSNGIPNFIDRTAFLIFTGANMVALVSSTTTVLTFMGVLTSRYAEDDFLWDLPLKLAIGLTTLFLAIAAMLVAFGASVHMSLSHRVHWIWALIGGAACVPLIFFAVVQFQTLCQVVRSTCGPSIFGKKKK